MKRHISIFAFLLSVFVATEAVANQQSILADGYWQPGETELTYKNDYLTPGIGYVYPPDSGNENQNVFSAGFKPGWAVDHWRRNTESFLFSDGTKIKDTDGLVTYTCPYSGTDTIYLAVKFKYITYTLRYDTDGGSAVGDALKLYTDSFNLATSAKTGYTFRKWRSSSLGTEFDAGASVSGASFADLNEVHADGHVVNLVAQWTANAYTVSFDGNGGGTPSPTSTTVTYDSTYGPLATCTREGWQFDGWYTATDGGTKIEPTTKVAIVANQTLYAHWTQKFKVTFREDSRFGGAVLKEEYVLKGGNATPPEHPVHEGYTSRDWDGYMNVQADKTVTAEYDAKSYFVTFHANDGSANVFQQNFVFGTPGVLPTSPWRRAGYEFEGWGQTPDATKSDCYQPGETFILPSPEGFDLFAIWKPISYTVAFDGNGGAGSMDDVPLAYGAPFEVPGCKFTKTGCEFKSWSATVSGVATNFVAGEVVSNLTTEANATVTFTAEWIGYYTVAFDANGGAGTMTNLAFELDRDYQLPPNAFIKTGYRFLAWDDVLNGKRYEDGANVRDLAQAGETNTLHAVWSANTYTVVFQPGGATGEMAPQDFVYDQSQALRDCTFVRGNPELWSFAGWTNSAAGGPLYTNRETVVNLTAQADGRVELTAVWSSTIGELSIAMGCDNLKWDNTKATEWKPGEVDFKDEGKISCVYATGTSEAVMQSSAFTSNGVLSFWWKATGSREAVILNDEHGATITSWRLDDGLEYDKWHEAVLDVDIGNKAFATFRISHREGGDGDTTCWIAKMTWTPEGGEPKYAGEDTKVTDFSMADGKLSFSFDSDGSSTYHILGTNDVTAPWPWPFVREIEADEKQPVQIDIKADEPKMFYRIRALIP